jgi:hypothetical protein
MTICESRPNTCHDAPATDGGRGRRPVSTRGNCELKLRSMRLATEEIAAQICAHVAGLKHLDSRAPRCAGAEARTCPSQTTPALLAARPCWCGT